jgi:hypothetical protein
VLIYSEQRLDRHLRNSVLSRCAMAFVPPALGRL